MRGQDGLELLLGHGLLDSFGDARHAPINLGRYLTDPALIQCAGETCSFAANAYTPFVMVGAEQNFTDWGYVGSAHQTRQSIATLPAVSAEPSIDIRYGRVNDGAGPTELELRRFFQQWMSDAAQEGYIGDPNLRHKALRYRTAPEVRLIGAPTELEIRETIAAVQTINSALPEAFKLTIGKTLTGLSFPSNRADWNRENVIAIEYVDLQGGNVRTGGHSIATADNEYRPDGSIAWSHIRMTRAVDTNLERHVMLPALVHELAHALGFAGHIDGFQIRSILRDNLSPEFFRPIDREALRVLYSRLEPGEAYPFSFGPWASSSLHVHGNLLNERRSVMAGEPRDTAKYKLTHRGKIVHRGITNDLERREREHQEKWPGSRIEQIGRKTTRDAAREWEKGQKKT